MRLVEPTPEEMTAGAVLGAIGLVVLCFFVGPYPLVAFVAVVWVLVLGFLAFHAGKYIWRCLTED